MGPSGEEKILEREKKGGTEKRETAEHELGSDKILGSGIVDHSFFN